jgi:hypothetical protein
MKVTITKQYVVDETLRAQRFHQSESELCRGSESSTRHDASVDVGLNDRLLGSEAVSTTLLRDQRQSLRRDEGILVTMTVNH